MSAPRFPTSPVSAFRRAEYGTDPVEVNPPAGLDRVAQPDECGTWLVVFIGAVVGLTILYIVVHALIAFFRLVAS